MRLTPTLSRGAAAGVAAVTLIGVAGAVVAATRLHSHSSPSALGSGPVAGKATVHVVGVRHGRVPWNHRLVIRTGNSALRTVLVSYSGQNVLDGKLSADRTTWTSATRLMPAETYRARVSVGSDSAAAHRTLRIRTTASSRHLTAILSPGDGAVVGVGSPIIVQFSRPVPTNDRALVESRLAVSTTPSVVGAWHWITAQEVHWRPPTYWQAHTRITVTSSLDGLYLGHGVWGVGNHQTAFKIGDSHISRVDVARHQMYVYQNRKLIQTFPISAGRTQYPTKNGVHITFEKSQVVTMDSATVGIPRNSPDGYYEQVYWDVRISYGGAFVHAAPWSVAEQGISNVSHGCVNISTSNAMWFYNWSLRGDIVDVYNSEAAPDTADPGMADWNMSWKKWVAGDAAPTGAALAIHPPRPHDTDPPAPKASTPVYTPPATSSPTPSPTPSKTAKATPSPSPTRKHHH